MNKAFEALKTGRAHMSRFHWVYKVGDTVIIDRQPVNIMNEQELAVVQQYVDAES